MQTLPKDEIGYESGVWPVLESPTPPDSGRTARRLLTAAALGMGLAGMFLFYFYFG
jgi:hypothetical protein